MIKNSDTIFFKHFLADGYVLTSMILDILLSVCLYYVLLPLDAKYTSGLLILVQQSALSFIC